jgi:hypothetical protein
MTDPNKIFRDNRFKHFDFAKGKNILNFTIGVVTLVSTVIS